MVHPGDRDWVFHIIKSRWKACGISYPFLPPCPRIMKYLESFEKPFRIIFCGAWSLSIIRMKYVNVNFTLLLFIVCSVFTLTISYDFSLSMLDMRWLRQLQSFRARAVVANKKKRQRAMFEACRFNDFRICFSTHAPVAICHEIW